MVPADDAGGGVAAGRGTGAGMVLGCGGSIRGTGTPGLKVGLQGGEVPAASDGERIERAVTINAVIAWRLAAMTLLGRDTPELPAGTLFSDIEIAALEDFAQDRKLPPAGQCRAAVLTTAMLGGYLNFKRKRYAGPGHQVLWEGYTRLATIVQACERSLPPEPRQQTLSEAA